MKNIIINYRLTGVIGAAMFVLACSNTADTTAEDNDQNSTNNALANNASENNAVDNNSIENNQIPDEPDENTAVNNSQNEDLKITVLRESSATAGDQVWSYQLLEVERHDGLKAYMQWVPAKTERPGALLTAQPYAGIDWTGQEVDTRWAVRGNGYFPDDDSPQHDTLNEGGVSYALMAPETFVSDNFIYLLNGISVLAVYGRFYAGGTIEQERDQIIMGLEFLFEHDQVNNERIGITGWSWGGFQALYGAAFAPDDWKPHIGVAVYPLSDFEHQFEFLNQDIPQLVTFPSQRNAFDTLFQPYARRVYAVTGGPPSSESADYSLWNHDALQQRLQTPFLVIHDEHDQLVPFDQSAELADELETMITPMWFRYDYPPDRNTLPIDHGRLQVEAGEFPIFMSTAASHLIVRLADQQPQIFLPYDPAALTRWMTYLLQDHVKEQGIEWAGTLFQDLVHPNIVLINMQNTDEFGLGAEIIAHYASEIFGWNSTADTIFADLERMDFE